ncbi:ethanolamine kinase 2 [Hoplias malabaricus]|uniref:ethanolamine kinase 2 n=1 Tax=Hoplias malabaricus TaxID=27720 RepID=UPI0034628FAF
MEPRSNKHQEKLLHIDVCLDECAPHTGITELFKILRPHWKAEEIQTKVFTEGITNQLLCCSVGQEPGLVLVRVYGRKTELFVDRKREMEMFGLLHAHGCGPQLYCTFQNGICYEFLKGMALEDPLLSQPTVYRLIAGEMGKLHSIKVESSSAPAPILWSKLSNYLQLLQSMTQNHAPLQHRSGSPLNVPGMDVLLKELKDLRTHLMNLESPTVLCHNDLLTKNILYDSATDTVKFIDYEYADFNYQAYDIGNHFNEYAGVNNVDYSLYPSEELQWDWLTEYLHSLRSCSGLDAAVTDRDVQELYVKVCKFSLASHFCWGLWALIQTQFSTINFDFPRYAAARFSFYFLKKEEYFGMTLS